MSSLVLFIVLSGFSGLKDFSLQYTSVFDPDLKVLPSTGKTISFSDAQQLKLSKIEGVASYSQIIEERIFMQFRGKKTIGYIKGVDENFGNVNAIDSIMIVAPWFEPNKQEVVIGYGISQKLGLGARDYLNLLEIFVPKPGVGQLDPLNPGKDFNKESVVVSGVYFVNEELNSKYVFSDLNFARNLLSLDTTKISGLEIKLKDGALENDVRDQISQIFNNDVLLKNRIEQNDALYKMLNTENVAVYLICTLVMIIALFNVIGSIIMMILDKRKNIKTLYNMGATLRGIRRIFFLQGALMTFLGGVLGIILGVVVVWFQLKYEFIHITPTLPYPVKLKFENILIVFATISILGLLAASIAASRVRERLIE